ncbi:porin [Rhodoflexus caldus]|uniref:porin n=1 Tax=Rhodoflexus caldus TaxID=2891236 RepID=UPI00202A095D|nr:porin [Rhodoflexus caldus]
MGKWLHAISFCVVWCAFSITACAQGDGQKGIDHSYKPLTLKLDDSGNKYVRFIIWHHFWLSRTQNNPGTRSYTGEDMPASVDFGVRRSRFLAYAQVSPRFLVLTHFGINNQNFASGGAPGTDATNQVISGNKKPQIFFHDIWTEYMIADKKLYIGTGLHYWNGISRMSSHSTLNFMTMDAPIFNWPLIENNDQFARQYGVYAKGQLGKFDYRIAVNKPFLFDRQPLENRAFGTATEKAAFSGYFNYMFKESESNKLPFFVGSYLGAKTVFNIGAGFYYHPESTASLQNGVKTKHDIVLWGADLFYDRPLNGGKNFLSLYSVFYNYDFGPNYLRNIGILNPEINFNPTTVSFNGPGNAQPTIGTGQIWYTQVGFGLPKLKNGTQFMPYATHTWKNFEYLNQPSHQFDIGFQWFINQHNAKISLQYGARPVYDLNRNKLGKLYGEWILQTHIFI